MDQNVYEYRTIEIEIEGSGGQVNLEWVKQQAVEQLNSGYGPGWEFDSAEGGGGASEAPVQTPWESAHGLRLTFKRRNSPL